MKNAITTVYYSPAGKLQTLLSLSITIASLAALISLVTYILMNVITIVPSGSTIGGLVLTGVIVAIYFAYLKDWLTGLIGKNQALLITAGGLIFPFGNILHLRGRRWRRFEELKSAQLRWGNNLTFESGDMLLLSFNDGCVVKFDFRDMPKEEIEKLLVALSMWAPPSTLLGEFSEARNALSANLKLEGKQSFTALWNDELSRRFSLAIFSPLKPGTKLQNGRYEVVSQLSFGGFNAVYTGLDLQGEEIIIKELALEHLEDNELRKSLLTHMDREVQLLARLHHPQICEMRDAFVENGKHYLVLEKIPGKSLRQIILEYGPMPQEQVIKLAQQMAEILHYLHNQKLPVVHRDFTPENLILKGNDTLILIDFNAATEFLSGLTGTIIGKHCYMAAEQIRGKAEQATDYYAMAGTIFFLLTGRDPRPLSPINLQEEGIPCCLALRELLFNMSRQDIKDRPNLDTITATLDECSATVSPATYPKIF